MEVEKIFKARLKAKAVRLNLDTVGTVALPTGKRTRVVSAAELLEAKRLYEEQRADFVKMIRTSGGAENSYKTKWKLTGPESGVRPTGNPSLEPPLKRRTPS